VTALLAYLAFALFAIIAPGVALQRLARTRIDVALVLPLGYAFCAGAYGLSLVTHVPALFPLIVMALDASLLWRRRGWALAPGPSLRGALPALVALVAVLALTEYGQNRLTRAGDLAIDPLLTEDTVFHVGLTWELAQGYPPQVPGLSGVRLDYHLGQPLVRAAACRWAGIDPLDALSRFDVTLAALALLLALRATVNALGGSARAAALVSWFFVASDLSFLFAWGRHVTWWVGILEGSHGLISLLHANSVIPALALALASLVAYVRFARGEGRGWLILCALLGLAVPFFKVFVAGHVLLGLGVAFLVARRRWPLLVWSAPLALVTLWMVSGRGAASVAVTLAPLLAVRQARESLGLVPVHGVALGVWALLWAVGGLGLRLTGGPSAWRTLRERSGPGLALAVMAWVGWPLGMLLQIAPRESNGFPFDEALYFFEQSGLILWVFAALTLGRMRWSGWRGLALGLICVATTLPATIHTLVRHVQQTPQRIPPDVVLAMQALERDSLPGAVVLQRPLLLRHPPPPLFFGRRVPYGGVITYFNQFVPVAAAEARLARVQRFFRTTDPAEAAAIARELGATHVCLFGSDEVAFDKTVLLMPIFENEGARVYGLRR
jgi:hypothetical protein